MKEKYSNREPGTVAGLFDRWAESGRDAGMEAGHQYAVLRALEKVSLPPEISVLDIGCGNGWLVRRMLGDYNCKLAVGIDASEEMVKKASQLTGTSKADFRAVNILEWQTDWRFNFAVSMEAFYYIRPMEKIFRRLPEFLQEGAKLLVGTDYYTENPGSRDWAEDLSLPLDRRSISEWRLLFEQAGFSIDWQTQIRYPDEAGIAGWKKIYGSLFTCGTFTG